MKIQKLENYNPVDRGFGLGHPDPYLIKLSPQRRTMFFYERDPINVPFPYMTFLIQPPFDISVGISNQENSEEFYTCAVLQNFIPPRKIGWIDYYGCDLGEGTFRPRICFSNHYVAISEPEQIVAEFFGSKFSYYSTHQMGWWGDPPRRIKKLFGSLEDWSKLSIEEALKVKWSEDTFRITPSGEIEQENNG